MLLTLAALIFPLCGNTPSPTVKVWEKPLGMGLTYRMEVDERKPLLIHALRLSLQAPSARAVPELAGKVVYAKDATKGRGSVSQMVAAGNAVAGINGDFFPFTGDPLGLMVRSGELVSTPWTGRAVFAWGPSVAANGFAKFQGEILPEGGPPIIINGINESCGDNAITLDTTTAGLAMGDKPNLCAVLKVQHPVWAPSTEISAIFDYALPDASSTPISADRAIIVARGTAVVKLAALKPAQKLTIHLAVSGFDWEKIENAVGGGPTLVKAGKLANDAEEEGFKAGFSTNRHPRSGVGRTADGDIWFVAVDGRQSMSLGCTLDEFAQIFLRLGCTDAINLDGGGSTDMTVMGEVVNRPSDGTERAVANGILFYVDQPKFTEEVLSLNSPRSVNSPGVGHLSVKGKAGKVIPNREIIWAAKGAGWIDQGGTLHGFKPGKAEVSAWVRGQHLSASVIVTGRADQPLVLPKED